MKHRVPVSQPPTSGLQHSGLLFLVAALALSSGCSNSETTKSSAEQQIAATTLVQLAQGELEGTVVDEQSGIVAWKGIPYAAAPIGELRFKPPASPAPWQGIREADEFGLPCWQHFSPATSIWTRGEFERSEDCLFLNIWSGAALSSEASTHKRPVMVWFHGGSHTVGHAHSRIFDGTELARLGAVLVSVNYRLGSFGFLAHPSFAAESPNQATGNWGLHDKVAALEWVRDNIATFGGDPENVTIFGQSAGSASVCVLQASPLARGLFHRAIGQSAACFAAPPNNQAARKSAATLAQTAGIEGTGSEAAQALRELPAERLLALELESSWLNGPQATVDGWLLPRPAVEIFEAGEHNAVPVLVGSTANEGYQLFPLDESLSQNDFDGWLSQQFGDRAAAVAAAYADEIAQSPGMAQHTIFTDQFMAGGMRTWADLVSSNGDSAYLYYMSHIPPAFRLYMHDQPQLESDGEPVELYSYGAYHSGDLVYVFGNVGLVGDHWRDSDHQLARTMSRYWVEFARSGDPNAEGLPTWPEHDLEERPAMEFGEPTRARTGILQQKLDALLGD